MKVFAFFIINKSGGMIYKFIKETKKVDRSKETVDDVEIEKYCLEKRDLNDLLVLNSTLHTIHQMASAIYGQSQKFYIHLKSDKVNQTISIFKTMTRYSFVFIADEKIIEGIVDNIYSEFTSYVLRNPAYMNDMPINLSMFRPYKYF